LDAREFYRNDRGIGLVVEQLTFGVDAESEEGKLTNNPLEGCCHKCWWSDESDIV
jgi:hypothetical protein